MDKKNFEYSSNRIYDELRAKYGCLYCGHIGPFIDVFYICDACKRDKKINKILDET